MGFPTTACRDRARISVVSGVSVRRAGYCLPTYRAASANTCRSAVPFTRTVFAVGEGPVLRPDEGRVPSAGPAGILVGHNVRAITGSDRSSSYKIVRPSRLEQPFDHLCGQGALTEDAFAKRAV